MAPKIDATLMILASACWRIIGSNMRLSLIGTRQGLLDNQISREMDMGQIEEGGLCLKVSTFKTVLIAFKISQWLLFRTS